MLSPLTITSLNQGKLLGEKPTVEDLDAHGALMHQQVIGARARKHLARKLLVWLHLFAS